MELHKIQNKISIQVSLDGYYFKTLEANEQGELMPVYESTWLSPSKLFTTTEFQKRYDEVEISLFTHKCTLIPNNFFRKEDLTNVLDSVVELGKDDIIDYVDVEQYSSKLVFSNSISESLSSIIRHTVLTTAGTKARILPELYFILRDLNKCNEYNKILISYKDAHLHIAIAQGKTLILANTYSAVDFTTAQYFLFLAMKNLHLNPEISTVCLRTPLEQDDEMSLYRYFKAVEKI